MNPLEMIRDLSAENALLKLEIEKLKKEKENVSLSSKSTILFFNYSVNGSVCETSMTKGGIV